MSKYLEIMKTVMPKERTAVKESPDSETLVFIKTKTETPDEPSRLAQKYPKFAAFMVEHFSENFIWRWLERVISARLEKQEKNKKITSKKQEKNTTQKGHSAQMMQDVRDAKTPMTDVDRVEIYHEIAQYIFDSPELLKLKIPEGSAIAPTLSNQIVKNSGFKPLKKDKLPNRNTVTAVLRSCQREWGSYRIIWDEIFK